jgi:hypothetical protein
MMVWLTQSTTAFASLPHVECVCPDGTKKPFCFVSFLGDSHCCCRQACCPSIESVTSEKQPSCCSCTKAKIAAVPRSAVPEPVPSSRTASKSVTKQPGVQQRGCQKSAAEVRAYVSEEQQRSLAERSAAWVVDSTSLPRMPLGLGTGISAEPRPLPPPPDLVLFHCRFVI